MTKPSEHPELEDRLGGAVPFEAIQERSPADVAEKIRFLYQKLQARLAVRERTVESLLQQKCETGTRTYEVVRPYGSPNEWARRCACRLGRRLT